MAELKTIQDFAKSGTEHGEQVAAFVWAQRHPSKDERLKFLFAIPNGGSRGDTSRSAMIRGAALKAEGVKTGVPDMMLPVPMKHYAGLFIELKKIQTGKGTLSKEQKDVWIPFLTNNHYCVQVAYGWRQVAEIITWYLELEPWYG